MLVYRVENERKQGPYHYSSELSNQLCDAHENDPEHPGATDFMGGDCTSDRDCTEAVSNFRKLYSDYIFGFSSLDDVYAWFQGFLDDLALDEFKIVCYNVDHVVEGLSKKQCIFKRGQKVFERAI